MASDITLSDGDNLAIYQKGWDDCYAVVESWWGSWVPYAPFTFPEELTAEESAAVGKTHITIA